jgi:hypothetical protein
MRTTKDKLMQEVLTTLAMPISPIEKTAKILIRAKSHSQVNGSCDTKTKSPTPFQGHRSPGHTDLTSILRLYRSFTAFSPTEIKALPASNQFAISRCLKCRI